MSRRGAIRVLTLLAVFWFLWGCNLIVRSTDVRWGSIHRSWWPQTQELSDFLWESIPPSRKLVWIKCYQKRECARLIVPLDYSDSRGGSAVVALVRKRAAIPPTLPAYRGPVLMNPGGPGGSGVDLVRGAGGDQLSIILGPQFDVVGFDPRGIGRSLPRASFFQTDVERALWQSGNLVDVFVNNSYQSVGATWSHALLLGQLAENTDTGSLKHINTQNTARDMLSIVEAHGRRKLQYWGFSYGTVLGATFASLFPDRVERIVIDGVVDAENYFATLWSNNLLDTDKALESFFVKCSEAGPTGCAFWAPKAADIKGNLEELYDAILSKPMAIKTPTSYGILDHSRLRMTVFISLYVPYALFPVLARGLADLSAGNGTLLFNILQPPTFECSCDPTEHLFDVVGDAQAALICNDGAEVPGDLEAARTHYNMMSEISQWGPYLSSLRIGCAGWPRFPKDHFQGPFEANTSYPILLVGNTADPITPLWAAKKMSRGFKGSVVLTQDSAGHCSVSGPSLCTQLHIHRYFAYGSLPKEGTICPVIGEPFPGRPIPARASQAILRSDTMNGDVVEGRILEAVEEMSKNQFLPIPFRTY